MAIEALLIGQQYKNKWDKTDTFDSFCTSILSLLRLFN